MQRADATEQRARDERAALSEQLATVREDLEQRLAALSDRAQAAELAREHAETALGAGEQLRAQLQQQLATTEKRLAAAEKARDAAIATVEQAAQGRRTPPRRSDN
jgi:chromosome segregation ATPase